MMTVDKLISLWPSAEVFADDIGLKWRSHARVMKVRGRIPRRYWPAVVDAAKARGIKGVSIKQLENIHAPQSDEAA